jgi:hypothetical protein
MPAMMVEEGTSSMIDMLAADMMTLAAMMTSKLEMTMMILMAPVLAVDYEANYTTLFADRFLFIPI